MSGSLGLLEAALAPAEPDGETLRRVAAWLYWEAGGHVCAGRDPAATVARWSALSAFDCGAAAGLRRAAAQLADTAAGGTQ